MTAEEIEAAKLDIERQRLALEQAKAQQESRFITRHSGVLISATVSLAAVVVSAAQIYISNKTAATQQSAATIQHDQDAQTQKAQREREFLATDAERKRELDLSAARLVIENSKVIFESKSPDDRAMFANLLSVLYPPEVSEPILRRLQKATPKNTDQQVWQAARRTTTKGANAISPDGRLLATTSGDHVSLWDANSGGLVRTYATADFISSVSFTANGDSLLISSVDGRHSTLDLRSGMTIGATPER